MKIMKNKNELSVKKPAEKSVCKNLIIHNVTK